MIFEHVDTINQKDFIYIFIYIWYSAITWPDVIRYRAGGSVIERWILNVARWLNKVDVQILKGYPQIIH